MTTAVSIAQRRTGPWTMADLLGVSPVEDEAFLDLAESGIPLAKLQLLLDLGLTKAELHALVIPPRTLSHRRALGVLNREESDRLLRVLRSLTLAHQVFGAEDKALRWLRKPKSGLGGRTPLMALETETGARLVEEWLIRIDSGMAA
ncbi:MAG: type II RES/Xre toxin-antitoxin system antitoxin [Acidithiobacillus sp.]